MLVWWAAWQVHPGKIFLDYAILGDDIERKVPLEYLYSTSLKDSSLMEGLMIFHLFHSKFSIFYRVLLAGCHFSACFIYRLRGASYRVSSKRGMTQSLVGIGIGYCSIHRVASGLTRLRGGESSLRRGL